MRYGVSIPPFTDARTVVDMAREAEASGWDGVFVWDHVQWNGKVEPLDPWVTLGAFAAVTERVVLGTMVTPLSRRRPVTVAKQLVTLDLISQGRAVLGVGLGEPDDRDFADLGEEADPRTRAAMLDEALVLIDSLLQGPTDHRGTHYTVRADLRPLPVQRPRPPVWVAGVVPNRRPLARARRWDGVVPIGGSVPATPEEIAAYVSLDGEPPRPDWDVVAAWVDGVPAQEYADAGATWLIASIWPKDDWVDELRTTIRRGPNA